MRYKIGDSWKKQKTKTKMVLELPFSMIMAEKQTCQVNFFLISFKIHYCSGKKVWNIQVQRTKRKWEPWEVNWTTQVCSLRGIQRDPNSGAHSPAGRTDKAQARRMSFTKLGSWGRCMWQKVGKYVCSSN